MGVSARRSLEREYQSERAAAGEVRARRPRQRDTAHLRFVGAVLACALGTGVASSAQAQYAATVEATPPAEVESAGSRVTRRDLDERLPKSAPEALRFEPGVAVQQTAHGQASPYVRGMTGQQLMHLFDGIRLNNGIYRRGPNQYFFTVDSYSLQSLEVQRGAASTRWGSDALGGAILATPRQPDFALQRRDGAPPLVPRLYLRTGSADNEYGGRMEVEAAPTKNLALLGGGGYRELGLLRGGGLVSNAGRPTPDVPRLAEDGKTQLGTGFREATYDLRLEGRVNARLSWALATYGYMQFDSPRTDQCPPTEAPESECLSTDLLYRALTYGALTGRNLNAAVARLDVRLSWQRHEETQTRDRPRSFVRVYWQDEVDTFGISAVAETAKLPAAHGALWVEYGADLYVDQVRSSSGRRFTDIENRRTFSRGQYIDGSSYLSSGLFANVNYRPRPDLTFSAGGRGALVHAAAPGDPASGSVSVAEVFGAAVGRAGVTYRALAPWQLHLNVDQGFRAPNLDDLTARQQTGPGFQFENADLKPERSVTYEAGTTVDWPWLRAEAWTYLTTLDGAMLRALKESSDCPPETPDCLASRNQLQLINADAQSYIVGTEGAFTAYPHDTLTLRSTLSYAHGDSPNVGSRAGDSFGTRVPISRIPPLQGTVEARFAWEPWRLTTSAALRWSLAQRRLAPSDLTDTRIPLGGTPGFATFDLRATWRLPERLALSLLLENLFDSAYRIHGSSINGPGRSATLALSAEL